MTFIEVKELYNFQGGDGSYYTHERLVTLPINKILKFTSSTFFKKTPEQRGKIPATKLVLKGMDDMYIETPYEEFKISIGLKIGEPVKKTTRFEIMDID